MLKGVLLQGSKAPDVTTDGEGGLTSYQRAKPTISGCRNEGSKEKQKKGWGR